MYVNKKDVGGCVAAVVRPVFVVMPLYRAGYGRISATKYPSAGSHGDTRGSSRSIQHNGRQNFELAKTENIPRVFVGVLWEQKLACSIPLPKEASS